MKLSDEGNVYINDVNLLQLINAKFKMVVTLLGILNAPDNPEQSINELCPIILILEFDANVNSSNPVHPLKALSSITSTFEGIVNVPDNPVHPSNALA